MTSTQSGKASLSLPLSIHLAFCLHSFISCLIEPPVRLCPLSHFVCAYVAEYVCLSEDVGVCVRNAVISSLISGAMITLSESLALCLCVSVHVQVRAPVCAHSGEVFVTVFISVPIGS